MFMGSSFNPRYFKEKVNLFVALGPVASLNHMMNPIILLTTNYWRFFKELANLIGLYNLTDFGWGLEALEELVCNIDFLDNQLCIPILNFMADAHPTEEDNLDRLEVFLKDFPSGEGWLEWVHFAQMV